MAQTAEDAPMCPEGFFKNGVGSWLLGEGISWVSRKNLPRRGQKLPSEHLPAGSFGSGVLPLSCYSSLGIFTIEP